ncbi:PhoX family protein [Chromatocurvus halotolerans]|uniref:PhoX family phosphatase n=1 Tax=Chromatocurvus halotolerans TaxID=1132028 RepID=A0A4V2SBL3_9GAMM|nr:PhoX family phosphatase [Chromatocurvus halotolerans]TCO75890.1 hypothetical protein EV688_10680 [Chromatocurvus halotolerans]
MITDNSPNNASLHDDMENVASNISGNTHFSDIVNRGVARRSLMKGSLAAAAAGFFAPSALAKAAGKGNGKANGKAKGKPFQSGVDAGNLVTFTPVSVEQGSSNARIPHISNDYEYQTLIPWGTPLVSGATGYDGDPDSRPTADEATRQVGIGHDGMWFYPENNRYSDFVANGYQLSSTRGLLVVNHEYGTNGHVLGKAMPDSLEDVRLSQHVHGVTVADIRKARGSDDWELVTDSRFNRRIHVNTEVTFSGPAAGSPLLQNLAGNPPMGTANNCGSGPTPWGTYITCEENFNGYFGSNEPDRQNDSAQDRYGFSNNGFGYGWHLFDERFDLANEDYANEQHRFGWCVEIDPFNPDAKPVKRTALGRFKHEAVAIKEIKGGHIAAYMGDDQVFDYCYKYESRQPWRNYIRRGESPLDDGRLYVARFNADGTGEWIELSVDNPKPFKDGKTLGDMFADQAELLVFTRLAADHVGATPMDRPEWATIGKDGEVYWALTNNGARTEPNAANPEAPNTDGHIIKTVDRNSNRFNWELFFLASDTRGTENVVTDPDAAWADDEGRLFIGTDGGQPDGLQDQLVVFDTTAPGKPEPKRLFVGVSGDEITGYATTPDYRYAFINVQHPGNGSPAATNFPAPDGSGRVPRDCTVVLRRKDGGRVGS